MAAYRRVYDSRHLQADLQTAKNRDQLRNHTLGNRVWATFFSLILLRAVKSEREQRNTAAFASSFPPGLPSPPKVVVFRDAGPCCQQRSLGGETDARAVFRSIRWVSGPSTGPRVSGRNWGGAYRFCADCVGDTSLDESRWS